MVRRLLGSKKYCYWQVFFWVIVLLYPFDQAMAAVVIRSAQQIVTVGDRFNFEIVVPDDAAQVVDVNIQPKMNVTQQGRQTSIEIINGQTNKEIIYRYQSDAQQVGQYQIGPARVRLDGQILSSNTISVIVQPAGHERFFAANVVIQPKEVYEGQLFSYQIAMTNGTDLMPIEWSWPGVAYLERYPGQQELLQTTRPLAIDGVFYQETDIEQWFYFSRSGQYQLRDSKMILQLAKKQPANQARGFFNFGPSSQQETIEHVLPEKKLNVLPLPTLPINRQFIGWIGHADVQWQPNSVTQNKMEGILMITGLAATQGFSVAPWVINGWHVYPEKPSVQYALTAKNEPVTRVKIALQLVATQGGNQDLPVLFDPKQGYVDLIFSLPQAPKNTIDTTQQEAVITQTHHQDEPLEKSFNMQAFAKPLGDSATQGTQQWLQLPWLSRSTFFVFSIFIFVVFGMWLAQQQTSWQRLHYRYLLTKAMKQDDHARWFRLYQRLQQDHLAPKALEEILARHLFCLEKTSPKQEVLAWWQMMQKRWPTTIVSEQGNEHHY